MGLGCAPDGDLADDLDAKTLKRGNVSGGVGEQADLADAEVREDLSAAANLTQGALDVGLGAISPLTGALIAAEEDAVRIDGAVDAEAAGAVVEIDEGAASGFGDDAEGVLDDCPVVGAGEAEDVLGERVSVDADRHGLVGGHIAEDKRDVRFAAVDFVFIGDHAELAVNCREGSLGDAVEIALMLQAVADKVGDGDHDQAVEFAEAD